VKIGVRARFLFLLALIAWGTGAAEPDYRLITDPRESARESALQLLRLLSAGNIEAAAELSNAPKRRYEVLRDYREAVGEEEFKGVFARYFHPGNRLLTEAAVGKRRLLIWELGQAQRHLAGQYFVEEDGRFVLDDVPHPERRKLERVLHEYRKR
jgi:hypothetical protein